MSKNRFWRTVLPVLLLIVQLSSCVDPQQEKPNISVSGIEITSDIQGEQTIDSIIAPYKDRMEVIMDEVIGFAAHDLTTNGGYESTLGLFVTRLCLEQSEQVFDRKIDVSIMNHRGGLRAPINKGDITLGEVYQVMPFENEVLLLDVPGSVLTDVIEHIGESGRSMIWPASFTVTNQGVANVLINGEPIDQNRIYVLSISDYLANGGGGFDMLQGLNRHQVEPVKVRYLIEKEIRERTERGEYVQASIEDAVIVNKS
ncbi:5'-nucleotidase C-terminal domain-containing protein [Aureitalea marina]|uniref:5'-Nucleotidase C-terminal domain-containing protein n=1 Tax=Aureitalea marina TaxID=930804 RepID=A0A2S7KP01_9FLAO|nr:5'-nucleotidase [Aureitalea marina]PQB04330.1 hypothetical protein BST85_05020 [Aureitalea marina]